MKKILTIATLVCAIFQMPISYADYFESQVLGTDVEVSLLENIHVDAVSFRNARENMRNNSVRAFVASVKKETIRRTREGEISFYRQYDIINGLGTLSYNMNKYFLYQKLYENTGANSYRETALEYLKETRPAYSILQEALKKSNQ